MQAALHLLHSGRSFNKSDPRNVWSLTPHTYIVHNHHQVWSLTPHTYIVHNPHQVWSLNSTYLHCTQPSPSLVPNSTEQSPQYMPSSHCIANLNISKISGPPSFKHYCHPPIYVEYTSEIVNHHIYIMPLLLVVTCTQ